MPVISVTMTEDAQNPFSSCFNHKFEASCAKKSGLGNYVDGARFAKDSSCSSFAFFSILFVFFLFWNEPPSLLPPFFRVHDVVTSAEWVSPLFPWTRFPRLLVVCEWRIRGDLQTGGGGKEKKT